MQKLFEMLVEAGTFGGEINQALEDQNPTGVIETMNDSYYSHIEDKYPVLWGTLMQFRKEWN